MSGAWTGHRVYETLLAAAAEGATLADRLRAAGGSAELRNFEGVTHEFFGADAVVTEAGQAQRYAGQRLRAALEPALHRAAR